MASEKFEELDDAEKARFANVAASESDAELSDEQINNRISDIFAKLRDNTVQNCVRLTIV